MIKLKTMYLVIKDQIDLIKRSNERVKDQGVVFTYKPLIFLKIAWMHRRNSVSEWLEMQPSLRTLQNGVVDYIIKQREAQKQLTTL